MSFGIGAFPFGLFQTTFTTNNTDQHQTSRRYSYFTICSRKRKTNTLPYFTAPGTPDHYQNELLSRVFLGIALAVILFIIFN